MIFITYLINEIKHFYIKTLIRLSFKIDKDYTINYVECLKDEEKWKIKKI